LGKRKREKRKKPIEREGEKKPGNWYEEEGIRGGS